MLKKENERIIKIPKGEAPYQEDDRPNKYPVISDDELRLRVEIIKKKEKRIDHLTELVISRDPSYKESGEPFDGYRHAHLVCTKALYPSEKKVSYCCFLPLIYEGTPKACTVRCPNGCIVESFVDLDKFDQETVTD